MFTIFLPGVVLFLGTIIEKSEDLIHIQYRNAELTLPRTVDFDALAALLRSIQTT